MAEKKRRSRLIVSHLKPGSIKALPPTPNPDVLRSLRALDPEKPLPEPLTVDQLDADQAREMWARHRKGARGDPSGIKMMQRYVNSVAVGLVPSTEVLYDIAEKLCGVLVDCTHLYDDEPPENFNTDVPKTGNKETGKSFVKHFGLQQKTRKTDSQLAMWCFFIWAKSQSNEKGKTLSELIVEAEEHFGRPAPETHQEMEKLRVKYLRYSKRHGLF